MGAAVCLLGLPLHWSNSCCLDISSGLSSSEAEESLRESDIIQLLVLSSFSMKYRPPILRKRTGTLVFFFFSFFGSYYCQSVLISVKRWVVLSCPLMNIFSGTQYQLLLVLVLRNGGIAQCETVVQNHLQIENGANLNSMGTGELLFYVLLLSMHSSD